MKLFANKKFTIIFTLCVAVLLVLILWLTTLFVQKNVFTRQVEQLKEEIATLETRIIDEQEKLEFKQEWEYVIEYAVKNGLLTEGELSWVQTNVGE